jgi:hypothetical protein
MPPTVLLDTPPGTCRRLDYTVSCFHRGPLLAQCIIARSPFSPPCPAVSCKSTTQSAVTRYTTTLAYTGKERSIKRSVPPKRGAIMPPLWRAPMSHDHHDEVRTGTYIRDSADAIPHAVPRTLVPKISGVHLRHRSATFHTRDSETYPYNTAYIVYPIRESATVTRNASNRNSPWHSN